MPHPDAPEGGPTSTVRFDAATLMASWSPAHSHPHKRALHALACPPGAVHRGRIDVTRWRPMPAGTPSAAPVAPQVDIRAGYFTYDPPPTGESHWHLNFADPHLFGFFEGPLFAQDEMQCAEIPALGAVRDALAGQRIPARTVDNLDQPTPVLVQDVERRVAVDTGPAPGRPHGLYGNAFARAPWSAVAAATTVLDPPVPQNILAMAAPYPGHGVYDAATIRAVLTTATTGFHAARWCSLKRATEDRLPTPRVVVHTGFWGCGAFGGNRELMIALQVLAARAAAIDRIVLHVGAEADRRFAEAGVARAEAAAGGGASTAEQLVGALAAARLAWGASDGN